MSNPYSILGISENATDDEVKKAYRTLARKYHPDANVDNPNKEMYEKKFKEVQNAYKEIMDMRKNGGSYYRSYSGGFSSSTGESDTDLHLRAAVNFIQNRRFDEAINLLESMNDRSAKWYYISAVAHMGKGDNETAKNHANMAASMEPGNAEYRQFADGLSTGRFNTFYGSGFGNSSYDYDTQRGMYGYGNSVDSDWCAKMCLYNLLCNCICNACFCR